MDEPSHLSHHPLTVAASPDSAPVKLPERRQLERRRPRRAAAWASKDLLRAALLVFALYFGLQLLWEVHPLILTAFVGLLFGLGVARGADHLERLHVPRGVSAGVLVLATYAALFGVMAIAAPTLQKQFGELRQRLPEALDRVDQWVAANRGSFWGQILDSASTQEAQPAQAAPQTSLPPPTPALFGSGGRRGGRAPAAAAGQAAAGQPATTGPSTTGGVRAGGAAVPGAAAVTGAAAVPGAAAAAGQPTSLRVRLMHQVGAATRYLFPFLSSTFEVLAGLLLITFVAIYFSVDPEVYRRGLLHLVPHPSRARADEVITAIGVTLRRWLATQLIAMVIIGSMVSISLALLGVEAALSLGIIAGVMEFIPTVGSILAALPAIAMGFLVSPQKALAVAIVFTTVQLIEGHLLIPMLMKRGMNLPPLVTIFGQALMAVVFGFLGLLVAVPLVAAVLTAVKMLYVNDVMGDGVRAGSSSA
ncbi:MAG TPA: AI-2E family transporter [Thermoanaerobaculia bacterium]|nr:AI-2E family transporter [Thermoanaerobaculia bacterium]